MYKSRITVKCVYVNEGEVINQILYCAFRYFLKRELEQDGSTLEHYLTSHV